MGRVSAEAQLQSRVIFPCLGATSSSGPFFRLFFLHLFLFTQFSTTSFFISLTVFSERRFLKCAISNGIPPDNASLMSSPNFAKHRLLQFPAYAHH
jgi:hypothetical protein